MAVYTYNLKDTQSLSYNSGVVYCESSEVTLMNSTYGTIKARAYATGSYVDSTGKYEIGWAKIDIKVTGFSSGVTTSMSLSSTSGAPSGYSYPKGTSFTASNVNTGYWINVVFGYNKKEVAANATSLSDVTLNTTLHFALVSGSTTITNAYKLNATLTFKTADATINVTYYRSDYEGGAQYGSPVKTLYNYPTTIKSGYSYGPTTDKGSGNYTVYYDSRGGSGIDPAARPWSFSQQITYSFSKWGKYNPGETVKFTGNTGLKAIFNTSKGTANYTYSNLGSLPTVYRKGYNKTNTWYDSDNSPVNPAQKVTSSMTIHVDWTGLNKDYMVTFDLNGGKMPEDAGRITDYTTTKTYDITGPTIPAFIPTKVGYKFVGWGDKNGNYVQQPGQYINDNIYNSINNEQSNNNVKFFAKWEYNPNTVKLNYWYDDSASSASHDDYSYNKDSGVVKYGAPSHDRPGDYAFLGWSDVIPAEWEDSTKVGEGWHGVYNIPPQEIIDIHGAKSKIELPITIDTATLNKLEDWGHTGDKAEQYYGIWAKTGKYVYINDGWRKVSNAYVRIDGAWKTVVGVWTYIDGEWKEEI